MRLDALLDGASFAVGKSWDTSKQLAEWRRQRQALDEEEGSKHKFTEG